MEDFCLKVETGEHMLRRGQCAAFPRFFLPASSLVQSLSFRFVPQTWNGGVVGYLIEVGCKVENCGWEEMLVNVFIATEC